MTNSAMRLFVRSIIAEAKVTDKKVKKTKKAMRTSVDDRLKMIDEAGDKAALQAKIAKIEEDIKEANEIKSAIPSNISHFVDREIIGDLMDDLAASIEELQAKKTELEEQMKGLDEASAKSASGMDKKAGDKKVIKKENIHNTPQMGGVTTSKGTAGYADKTDKKGGDYDPKAAAANLAKLRDFGPKKKK